jgi:hypothetical protein
MQDNKYYYNGIPLADYCKKHNIKLGTMYGNIYKKKHNPKYNNYTDQEIVNMVVNSYGKSTKYMYEGITLRQYCINNNINIATINSRINTLKKQNSNLSDDELVIKVMEEYDNQNYRFFYHGIPLKEYCINHDDLNYNTIRAYVNREKKKNPDLSDEELIDKYIAKEHKGIYTYYYLGIPLKEYCIENNLVYRNIISYMSRCRNDETYKSLSDDQFVEAIMDKYQPFEPKYIYKGITLREYCRLNNISYFSVVSFVKRNIARGSKHSIDELIDEGINTINRYGIIYYYKGIPLKDYALENNLNASSIRSAIIRKLSKSDKTLQEVVDECVETYKKLDIKYYYNGMSLYTYCNSINLNYNTVIHRYLDEYANNSDISIDVAIKNIVDYYKEYPPTRNKYYFNNQSLRKFCDENSYSYLSIWRRIKRMESNNTSNNDELIIKCINKYESKLQIDKISDIFNKLSNINSIKEIKDICEFLKIDFDNFNDLVNMGLSYNQAINIIWYFGDKNNNGELFINDIKIEYIFLYINKLENNEIDVDDMDLYILIGIYKSELYDSRKEIILRENKYINSIISKICNSYNIQVNKNNIEDFQNEIKYYLLVVLSRISLNNMGQIIKYIDLSIKGYFKKYLSEYQKNNYNCSIEDRINTLGIDVTDDNFSLDMMNVLSNLSNDDLTFVIYKYQNNYSNEDIAKLLNISIIEVENKDREILDSLRENDNIKSLLL